MKTINRKAIYSPKGKAAEYGRYACNFYVGCSNGCTYCYLRKGIGKAVLGGDTPTLKKCFRDEKNALEVFEKELKANLPELQEHGLFFSFTTDPCLPETVGLTAKAMAHCMFSGIPVKILTKKVDFLGDCNIVSSEYRKLIAFGFTLTGHDELEPNASTNAERIEAMRKLHDAGFKTWASIEPVIDFEISKEMIEQTFEFCDLFKIGLESSKKYKKDEIMDFLYWSIGSPVFYEKKVKFYLKDSLLKAAGIRREDLPANCVTRDYNIFNNK